MYHLGISGLSNSMDFMRARFPGLAERDYRMSQGHDSAAALLSSGRVVAAAAEERFTGKQHTGKFPIHAIRYCLREAGIGWQDIDRLAHAFDYHSQANRFQYTEEASLLHREVLSRDALLRELHTHQPDFDAQRIVHVPHHMAHAASTYFASGWPECLVLVIDAMGEQSSASAYLGRGSSLRPLGQISANDSIGILYSLITYHLGFDFNADEYKIMGLAPYGDPSRHAAFFEREVILGPNGSVTIPLLRLNKTGTERIRYGRSLQYLAENLIAAREPEGPLSDAHRDVAAALQRRLEQTVMHICSHYQAVTGQRRLAYAGGVALNCTANGRLRESGLFDEIYIGPASGDDGAALGAAMYSATQSGETELEGLPSPYLGPRCDLEEIRQALKKHDVAIEVEELATTEAACIAAARRIADGQVITWFRGRLEFGARALGNRSILADPRHPGMRDRINMLVKKREAFRPFAPAVLAEEAGKWFEISDRVGVPFMTAVAHVRSEHRAKFPAATHIDGTARLQTVSAAMNPDFHRLLQHVRAVTGAGMVLNTSFNVRGQPIVAGADEAIATFLATGMDALFLHDFLITRRQ